MARKTDTLKIDGMEFHCTQLVPTRAIPLAARLARAFAPVLAGGEAGLVLENDGRFLTQALTLVFEKLDSNELLGLMRDILQSTSVVHNGEMYSLDSDDAINRAFDGRLRTMFPVLKFALGVNFGDFFGDGSKSSGASAGG